ncbi:MAG TPA: aminotransferase class I/II-fold pyridoxal phosphate-dependent enzyme [Geminicoccaceae bacterium]|nr:aminotransferase class I/II-fold pyridoxal phosphate-dependent enzyme [Geminicoccaceae bacterium]
MSERRPSGPSRRSAIAPFIVMEVMASANARAAAGADVLHLEVGQPGGGAPPAAIAAAKAAMTSGSCGYTEAFGLMALRRRISEHYRVVHGVQVDPERVAITVGASGAFILAFIAAFEAGDRVVVTEPGYPAYRNILAALGVEVVAVPTDIATRFQPTPELLERVAGPIHGLVLASPSNPAGTMLGNAELERLVGYCRPRGVRVVSDEIYHGITYDQPAETALAFCRDAIVVNSFSKYFCMTGWRLGWLVLPDVLVGPVTRLAQNLFISAPTIAQHAALGAFGDLPRLERRIERYRRNRGRLLRALPAMGLTRTAPADGAFYLYVDVSDFTDDSVHLCRRLLHDTGVALTPGVDFDPRRGHQFVRLSFAGAEAEIAEACERLRSWFAAAGGRPVEAPALVAAGS